MYSGLLKKLNELENANASIKVSVAGFGFIGRGLCIQSKYMKGIKVTVIYCRNVNACIDTLGVNRISAEAADNVIQIRACNEKGKIAIVSNPELLYICDSDIVIDTTGSLNFAAELAYNSIMADKHVITSPEMDICIGPYLKRLADARGLVYSGQDGDEPGVVMNLYEYVSILGFEVTAMGKFKNYTNHESNPDSVKPWSDAYKQNPYKIASFADGTKMNIEMGLVCNATGLLPDKSGMHCKKGTLEEVVKILRPIEEGGILSNKGRVDVVQGVEPNGGVFVVAKSDNDQIKSDMKYFKMGEGPYYLFYRPYHLCSVEILVGAANMFINKTPTIAPKSYIPLVDVASYAKKDLKAGSKLDCLGGYTFFGQLDAFNILQQQNYLPISLAEDAVLRHDVKNGEPINLNDVEVNKDSMLWQLREKMLTKAGDSL